MNGEQYGEVKKGLSELLGETWRMYRGHFLLFFLISAVTIPVDIAAAAAANWSADPADSKREVLLLLVSVVQYAFTLLATAAIVAAVAGQVRGQTIGVTEAYARALDRFSTLWWASLRAVIHVVLFAVTVIGIPWAIQRLVRWYFIEQAVVVEGMSSKESLSSSATVVKGHWWETFGSVIVLVLLVLIPAGVTTAAFWAAPPLVSVPASATVTAITTPFFAIGLTLLYFELKGRNERVGPASLEGLAGV